MNLSSELVLVLYNWYFFFGVGGGGMGCPINQCNANNSLGQK